MLRFISTSKKIKKLTYDDLVNTEGCEQELLKYIDAQDSLDRRLKLYGPSYPMYVTAQNILSVLHEYFFNEDRFDDAFVDMIDDACDVYMPDGPPMSPLTKTYFGYWSLFDAKHNGGATFAEYILKNIKSLKIFPNVCIPAIENLSSSRLGIYEHLGFADGNKILFKELVTDDEICTINAAGYRGKKGDLCLLRVALPLPPDDTHVVLSTPYILCGHSQQEWINYFERQGIRKDNAASLNNFMKNWPTRCYWHNFITDAYAGCKQSHIYLRGIPDIKGTKPHEMMDE